MGCDIHGYLEIKKDKRWYALMSVPSGRSYDSFGVLFGVRNYVDAKPVAAEKGLPDDLSRRMQEHVDAYDGDGHSGTWLNMEDLEAYDWDQKSTDQRISWIDKITGEEKGKAEYTHLQDHPEKQEEQGVYLKNLDRRAGDLLSEGWREFLKKMELLNEYVPTECLRVVVFFDN